MNPPEASPFSLIRIRFRRRRCGQAIDRNCSPGLLDNRRFRVAKSFPDDDDGECEQHSIDDADDPEIEACNLVVGARRLKAMRRRINTGPYIAAIVGKTIRKMIVTQYGKLDRKSDIFCLLNLKYFCGNGCVAQLCFRNDSTTKRCGISIGSKRRIMATSRHL